MKKHRFFDVAPFVLLLIGGICWGLIGAFGFDLIGSLFGTMSGLTRIIYVLIGLSAVYKLFVWSRAANK